MTNEFILEIEDLKANINDIEILKGINLKVKRGEIHAIMGPNGSGKNNRSGWVGVLGVPQYVGQ